MKEENVILTIVIAASMLTIMILPANGWEYSDTWIGAPQTDNLTEAFGPRADRLQIKLYPDELAEFNALEIGQIDMTDWPLDSAHYVSWTTSPKNASIAVVDTSQSYDMNILDMRLDNRTVLDDGSANWAYYYRTSVGGADILEPLGYNPMSDVWLRRAIATAVDKDVMVKTIVGGPPYLIAPLYTPLSLAYGSYVHPQITPTGALANYTYLTSTGFGTANVAWGNAMLEANGYVYDAVTGTENSMEKTST